jgi:serine/threonine protein kinase
MIGVLSVGQVIDGRYEIVAPIAQGGMGAVYRARRVLLGDEVAIKIIRTEQTGADARERFMRESRACARLRHPNIVSIFDFDVDASGNPFLVMELLNGPSLKEEIAQRGALDVSEVQRIIPPLCTALQLAHTCGIVHRDLKPANIVAHQFAHGERVYKIVDFGVANMRESTGVARLTEAHQFVGTLTYASPEQLSGAAVDHRSDQYSLASVVFEMVTGEVPFAGDDMLALVTQHLTVPVRRPSIVRPGIPAWIDGVLERALAKQPDDRWASSADFGATISAGDREGTTTVAGAVAAASASALTATYEVGERLGPGRLGSEVFRGVHRALGHPVAIRILRRGGQRNWDAVRARFLREARTLQVAHPSVIQVRDFGEEAGLVYVVTDFIEGTSLRDLITASGALPWPRLRPLLEQLMEAARALHRRKGLLCGLTPDIMRVVPPTADDDPERLMISAAGIWQAQDLLSTLQEQTLRGVGLADVELRYVAPELLTGQAGDVRSDVFTMAVLGYEMATAGRPYDGGSMPELLGAMLRGAVVDPRLAQPTLPESAAAALIKGLSPRPEDRFTSARTFGAALLA